MWLEEALEKIAEVEGLIRATNDGHLITYVADHIDSQGKMLGTSMAGEIFQTIENLREELK
jgi:hypothetical protein